jgi:hypothetical protein
MYGDTGAIAEHSIPAAPADLHQWVAAIELLGEVSNMGDHCIWEAGKTGLSLTSQLPLWVAASGCLL